jgi:hypothetical protein
MRKEYDFTKARQNPYAAQLKKQITIRLDENSMGYFKGISEQVGSDWLGQSASIADPWTALTSKIQINVAFSPNKGTS